MLCRHSLTPAASTKESNIRVVETLENEETHVVLIGLEMVISISVVISSRTRGDSGWRIVLAPPGTLVPGIAFIAVCATLNDGALMETRFYNAVQSGCR